MGQRIETDEFTQASRSTCLREQLSLLSLAIPARFRTDSQERGPCQLIAMRRQGSENQGRLSQSVPQIIEKQDSVMRA